jgi:hypothetical protein
MPILSAFFGDNLTLIFYAKNAVGRSFCEALQPNILGPAEYTLEVVGDEINNSLFFNRG